MSDTLIKTESGNETSASATNVPRTNPQANSASATTTAPVTTQKKSAASLGTVVRKRAIRQILVGVALVVIGVIVTAVTYHAASNNPSGGTYLVMWGPIAVGALTIFRGFHALASSVKIH